MGVGVPPPAATSLVRPDLHRNPITAEFAAVLAAALTIAHLIIASPFRRVSSAATSLVRLDLHDNPITSEFAADLAAVLARQASLKALVLNDTSLGDEGVEAVCAALCAAGAAPELEVRIEEQSTG